MMGVKGKSKRPGFSICWELIDGSGSVRPGGKLRIAVIERSNREVIL
jgi:hypothetical protein